MFKAIASTYHLKLKFSTRNKVGKERGNQKMARSYYVATLHPNRIGGGGASLPIEDMKIHENEIRGEKHAEDFITKPLDSND